MKARKEVGLLVHHHLVRLNNNPINRQCRQLSLRQRPHLAKGVALIARRPIIGEAPWTILQIQLLHLTILTLLAVAAAAAVSAQRHPLHLVHHPLEQVEEAINRALHLRHLVLHHLARRPQQLRLVLQLQQPHLEDQLLHHLAQQLLVRHRSVIQRLPPLVRRRSAQQSRHLHLEQLLELQAHHPLVQRLRIHRHSERPPQHQEHRPLDQPLPLPPLVSEASSSSSHPHLGEEPVHLAVQRRRLHHHLVAMVAATMPVVPKNNHANSLQAGNATLATGVNSPTKWVVVSMALQADNSSSSLSTIMHLGEAAGVKVQNNLANSLPAEIVDTATNAASLMSSRVEEEAVLLEEVPQQQHQLEVEALVDNNPAILVHSVVVVALADLAAAVHSERNLAVLLEGHDGRIAELKLFCRDHLMDLMRMFTIIWRLEEVDK